MTMPNHRNDRIAEEIKRELGDIIRELKDPRIPTVISVVGVRVTKDLRFAKAYVSALGDEKVKHDAIAALSSASGFIRREIGSRIDLRFTPEFTFVSDDSIEYGAHINEILNEITPSSAETSRT